MIARRSCSVGVFQSSFSSRTRPSALTSTTTASIGSTNNFIAGCGSDASCRGRARGIVDAQHYGRRRAAFGSAAVGVLDVDVGVADETQNRRETAWTVGHRRHDYVALADLMMLLAQNGAAVSVVVDDETQLTRSVEHHREHVHALVREQAADTREGAGIVGKSKGEFGANHAE